MNGQAKVGLQINMEGDVVARLNDLTKRVDEVAGHASKLDKVFKGFSVVKFDAIANSMSNLRNNINAMVAPGVEFQQEMANLSAITGTVGKDLEYATEQARKFGVSSGLGAKGIAQMQANIASNIDINKTAVEQGVKSVKVLDALTEQAVLLAQATGMNALPAADVLTASLNILKLDVSKAGLLVDLYANASQKGASEVDVLFESVKKTGALAGQFKINAVELASALEVISKQGLKGSEAGTAFQAMLAGFFKLPEIDVAKIGLEEAFREVKKLMQSQGDEAAQRKWVFDTFNVSGFTSTSIMKDAIEGFANMTDALQSQGVALQQATIRTNTQAFALKQTQERLNDFKISVFNASGGLVVWAEAAFSVLVPISQTLPLLTVLSQGFKALNVVERITTFWNGVCGGSFTGLAAAIWTATRAFWASPWGKAIAIITGVVAVASALAMKFDYVREKIDGVTNAVKNLLGLGGQIDMEAGVTMSTNVNDLTTRDKSNIDNQTLTDQFSEQNNSISSSGGSMVRNNNISIGNLIGQFTIKVDSVKNGGQNIKEQISRALIDAVRDTELALG